MSDKVGTYVAYYFTSEDNKYIDLIGFIAKCLLSTKDIKLEQTEYDPHITLMYDTNTEYYTWSKENEEKLTTPEDIEVECKTTFTTLLGHDNSNYLVMKLESEELVNSFNMLKLLGLKHSYDKFTPHVTLGIIDNYNGNNEIIEKICVILNEDFKKIVLKCHYVVEPIKE